MGASVRYGAAGAACCTGAAWAVCMDCGASCECGMVTSWDIGIFYTEQVRGNVTSRTIEVRTRRLPRRGALRHLRYGTLTQVPLTMYA